MALGYVVRMAWLAPLGEWFLVTERIAGFSVFFKSQNSLANLRWKYWQTRGFFRSGARKRMSNDIFQLSSGVGPVGPNVGIPLHRKYLP